ncbi:DNA internalization-related competence protein ComEC/Rec2 [Halioxenophilus sp. WMMB6]|uniref:DNA internalization-related competence protein ComEC/Rec2 n=1 Tax=Halioxenophilus sp. WMMB6 TaxID=3073815 RepID=UPI00295F4D88|nr:DNA internalization-related competence protein ComEC/Rec2 [Halioxenophilus sp. WMMB6]
MKPFLATFATALILVSYLPFLPDAITALGASGLLLLLLAFALRSHLNPRACSLVTAMLSAAALALPTAMWLGNQLLQRQLDGELEGQWLWLEGVVTGMPESDTSTGLVAKGEVPLQRRQFDFRVRSAGRVTTEGDQSCPSEQTNLGQEPLNRAVVDLHGKTRLSWYVAPSEPGPIEEWLSPGSVLCLVVKLRRPRGLVNPAGFDYQRYLLSAGYRAVGYVKVGHKLGEITSLPIWFDRQRVKQSGYFRMRLANEASLGAVLALAIGDRSLITEPQWQLLRQSGTMHLLVVSGLHISLAAGFGFLIGGLLARGLSLRSQRFNPWLPALLSMLFACLYAGLAGFTLPTQRAMVMALVANLFWLLGWQRQPWLGFWLAMVLVLLIDPLAGHGAGFWLSFAVVGVILAVQPIAQHSASWLAISRVQWKIFIGMLLPLALTTGSVSIWAPLVNLLAVPFISLVTVPAVLLTLAGAMIDLLQPLTDATLTIAHWSLDLFWWVLALLPYTAGEAPAVATLTITAGLWALLLLATVGLVAPAMPLTLRALLVGASALVLLVPRSPKAAVEVTVLDVGQGLATVVRVGESTLVYDTGPSFSDHFEAAGEVLTPYLKALGVETIDTLIISHGDSDHASGLAGLSKSFSIGAVYSGQPGRLPIPAEPCHAGVGWQWQGVSAEFIWPEENTPAMAVSANDQSCVLLLSWQDQRVLFTGDISKAVEWPLSEHFARPVQLLVAPHHGSKTSSSYRFIQAFAPHHVIFSTGYHNGYGHPNSAVLARYTELINPVIWNTADDGAILAQWDASGQLTVTGWRELHRRYWF